MFFKTRQSRRGFLACSLMTSGTLGLTTASGQGAEGVAGPISPEAIAGLRTRLQGRLLLPADPGYEAARRVFFWNPATERRPAMVVQCTHADDIRRSIEFARRHEIEIAVKGGGHSPMGWGISDGLVLDMAGMNRVTINSAKRVAWLEAGVLSGDVIRQAGLHGLAPVLGQCPGVGAAGVTLGGGLGWLSGLHGASCDNLVSARLVSADARVLSVDADRDKDLFWALRGAGANFGVTTSFEVRLHPVGPVTAGEIYYPLREARTVVRFFRDAMAEAPDAFQATLNLTPGPRGVFVSLCHAGEETEAERLLRAFRTVAVPTKDTVRRQAFADLAGIAPTGTPNVGFRCVATVFRDDFTDELIDKALDRLAGAPPPTVIGLTHYMHGAVCRVAPEATAFPLRQAGGVHIRIGLDWNEAAAAQQFMPWAEGAQRLLRSASPERIYANYQSHAGKDSAQAVYGRNHARLTALKSKYDPANCFRRNSNVEPTRA